MKRTSSELTTQVNLKLPDNTNNEIDGQDMNDIFTDFCDSMVPKSGYYDGVISGNITYKSDATYRITHNFGSQALDAVIYNYLGELLGEEYFYLDPIDDNTVDIIFYAQLGINDLHRYMLINLNM